MKIFIRADGGESIGLGHIMRTLVLANEFRRIGNEVIYLCGNNNRFKSGISRIKEDGFRVISLNENNIEDGIIQIQQNINADLLITDSYVVNEAYFDRLKPHFKITGYIDDVNKCKMNVDFIINQNVNARNLNYSKTTNEDTKLFLGPNYCMLREEFREHCNDHIYIEEASDILLTLGGMDDKFNTLMILKEVTKLNKNIHVVIGNAFKEELIIDLEDISSKNKNIILYKNPEMSSVMSKCQLAISACGSTLYELCAMRIPTMGIILADNQKGTAECMKDKGLLLDVIYVKNIDGYDFQDNIEIFSKDIKLLSNIIERQKKIIDANGVKNLVNSIIEMF